MDKDNERLRDMLKVVLHDYKRLQSFGISSEAMIEEINRVLNGADVDARWVRDGS